jgi:hypothetical protein
MLICICFLVLSTQSNDRPYHTCHPDLSFYIPYHSPLKGSSSPRKNLELGKCKVNLCYLLDRKEDMEPGMVLHTYNPQHAGGKGRRITV